MIGASDAGRAENLLAALSVAVAGRIVTAVTKASGRPSSDTAALMILATTLNGSSQDALGSALSLSQSGTVRLVDRLRDAGLVSRKAGPDDRTHAVVLTRKGVATAWRAQDERKVVTRQLVDSLNSKQRDGLITALEVMLADLTTSTPEAFRICRLCDPEACGHYMGRCPVTQALAASNDTASDDTAAAPD